ncbi:hypothetical protein PINS_up016740 [Pythium insidiosum]|nr:hypothetical protein PINS_up016740 [Pythium insidiosum]
MLAVVFASTLALTAGTTAYLALDSVLPTGPSLRGSHHARRLREGADPTFALEAQRFAMSHGGLASILEAHEMPSQYQRSNNGGGKSASDRRNSRSIVAMEAHGMPSGYERTTSGGGQSANDRRNSHSVVAAMEAHEMPSQYQRSNNGGGKSASDRRNSRSIVAMEAHGMPSGYERTTSGGGQSANDRRNSHSVVAVMEAHGHAAAHHHHHQ